MTGDAGQYAGRVILVTGARKGLGRLLTEHFLEGGGRVIGVSRGDGSVTHPNYEHRICDITDDKAVRDLFIAIARSGGQVDIVINNAAVLTSMHAILMPAVQMEDMVKTNFLGSLYVAREAAKLMRKRSFGRIIGVGSMAASLEPIGDSVYAATKAASVTLMAVLAKEFASFGITVNTIGVSAFETDMMRQLPRDKIDAVVADLPLPRYATPDDIFNVVDFFASERSGYITAQAIYLAGVHA